MSSVNSPFGLKPIRTRGGTPYSGATNAYFVPATYATALFIGDPVVKTGTANTARVSAPGAGNFPIGTLPEINRSAAGDASPITGVIVGFAPNPDGLGLVHNPASTARIVYVADDPHLVHEVQATAALTAVDVGLNANVIFTQAGNANTGLSGTELNAATVATTATFQLKILRVVNREDNVAGGTRVKLEVMINNHTEEAATAGI
jgi:hypothetical protein